jgi:hypothetical protein
VNAPLKNNGTWLTTMMTSLKCFPTTTTSVSKALKVETNTVMFKVDDELHGPPAMYGSKEFLQSAFK